MRPTILTRTLLIVMAVVAAIGAIDAGLGGSWDLVVLFAFLVLASLFFLLRTTIRRPLVPIRADLYRWLTRRAAVTGERSEHLIDRALSAYRADLVGDDAAGDQGHADRSPADRDRAESREADPDRDPDAGDGS